MGHMWLSDKLMNIKTLAITISLVVIVFVGGGNTSMTLPINAQQNLTSSSQSQNIAAMQLQKKKLTFWYLDKEQ
jgi:hypothetical protein